MRRLIVVFFIIFIANIIIASCSDAEEIVDVEETTSIASDSENIAALIFPTEDIQEVMVLHCCLGEVVVEIDSSGIDEIPVVDKIW